ncbi:MAG: NAD(P)H-binding protein [Geothrix sp.]|uniref:NAD(P)H-binding protein n=1 Tax=Geothrix sp. TaxID=1962974 RepID=UPI0017CF4D44|nr:NAD(P)H-binding protein [Geothrix sp.]NWJ41975.1 NAD(P)H-binding protein [Geothrix sp.]WIL20052.1 MAG: NAD(P)H-binding protein [Geothrix sp.]
MPTPVSSSRPRVALAGTSGFIGAALCEALGDRFDLRILTRSLTRTAPRAQDEVRSCDHFSRLELARALEGVDYAVYLVHNRDPSARLDQAQSRDMDLLVADNFAWAAARNGVRQILCRAPLLAASERPTGRDAREREEVLASRGVPLTVLRTGLVVGPGGELARLLVQMVQSLPRIPLPHLATNEIRPLSLEALLRAFQHCVGRAETFGGSFDVFGPEPTSLRRMLEDTADLLGRPVHFAPWGDLSQGAFAALLKRLNPSLHPVFVTYLLDMFSAESHGEANPVQQAVTRDWTPLKQCLGRSLQQSLRAVEGEATGPQRALDDETLRQLGRVRSIQRLRLPQGRNAEWVAERYFPWLGALMKLFVATERDADGSWTVRMRLTRLRLLRLDFKPTHSTPDRRMYFITGGALARMLGGRTARLEFRDLLGGRFTLVAIHDFNPALPWFFYRYTQAAMHGLVMKGFQGHMEQAAEGGPML